MDFSLLIFVPLSLVLFSLYVDFTPRLREFSTTFIYWRSCFVWMVLLAFVSDPSFHFLVHRSGGVMDIIVEIIWDLARILSSSVYLLLLHHGGRED
jgi:hypothetical protein